MSMLDSLLRFVDPVEFIKKQAERRRQKKAQPPGVPDDDDDVLPPPPRPEPDKAPLVCRVCRYQGGPEHRFCPRCLAETMERRR